MICPVSVETPLLKTVTPETAHHAEEKQKGIAAEKKLK